MSEKQMGVVSRHMSPESRAKNSIAHMGNKNCLGRILSPETRAKMSASKMGHTTSAATREKISSALKGHPPTAPEHATNETRMKMSVSRWKGGPKVSHKKNEAKRRSLGFIPLSKPFEGCDAYHIDNDHVIYIPTTLHRSIRHNIWTGRGMREINAIAIVWMNESPLTGEVV